MRQFRRSSSVKVLMEEDTERIFFPGVYVQVIGGITVLFFLSIGPEEFKSLCLKPVALMF